MIRTDVWGCQGGSHKRHKGHKRRFESCSLCEVALIIGGSLLPDAWRSGGGSTEERTRHISEVVVYCGLWSTTIPHFLDSRAL